MSVSRDRRVIELLEQSLELADQEAEQFLENACGDDADLRQKVDSLRSAMGRSSPFFDANPIPHDNPAPSDKPAHLDATTTSLRNDHGLRAGQVIADRYRIESLIGIGGMGEVYCARDLRLDRDVAIKTLRSGESENQELRDRFEREMRSVAALTHPNIVTLYDIKEQDEIAFAIMEYAKGETLRTHIHRGLNWQQVIRIARGIAAGLGAAHAREIMHRDIKPENIIVDDSDAAKILDFGLARSQSLPHDQLLTATNMTPGTIPYMSPEQAAGRDLTAATDVFSFGTVLYEMLAGSNPFRGDSALETMRRLHDATPPKLGDVATRAPAQLATIVHGMLAKEPSDRPQASDVAAQLEGMIAETHDEQLHREVPSRAPPRSSLGQCNQPSLIVLPFHVLGDSPALGPVAESVVENLMTVLTRVPMLSIASRMTSSSLKGKSLSASDIRDQFRVDFVIEGSLRTTDERVLANVQLVNTESGFQVWAQQFDFEHDENLIKDLMQGILTRLEPQLTRAIYQSLSDESGELTSRQLLLRAMSILALKGWHRESFEEVTGLLKQSIAIEPDLPLTHAYLALILGLGKRVGLIADTDSAAEQAVEHAERAMDLDDLDSNILGLAGCALADVGQTNRAIPVLQHAMDINPNNAQAYAGLGAALLEKGDWNRSIELLEKGIELSPADGRLAVWYSALANAHLQNGDVTRARTAAEAGCLADRKTYLPRLMLTAVHLAGDDADGSLAALQETLRVKPDLSNEEVVAFVGRKVGIGIRKLRRSIPKSRSD